jgi:hypothetical protein
MLCDLSTEYEANDRFTRHLDFFCSFNAVLEPQARRIAVASRATNGSELEALVEQRRHLNHANSFR